MQPWALLAAGAALVGSTVASAEDGEIDYGSWRFQVTPYVWATGLSGKVRPIAGVPTFSADLSFSDVLEDSDGAFFLNGTIRKDRFVILGDVTWAKSSKSETINVPFLPVPATVEGEVTQMSLTAAAGYSVVQQPDFALDLFGGARTWRVKAEVQGEADLGPFFVRRSAENTVSWVDPILGLRARAQLTPNWSLIGYADVGGFGAGSKSTWQVVGTVNYRVTDHFYLSAGYRHLAFDYEEDGTLLDIDMSGPLLGGTFRF